MDHANRTAEVPVSIDVLGLVRVLVGPSTEQQRFDWARYLLLQARQNDADLRYLYQSLHRKGPQWHRALHQLRRDADAPPASRSQINAEREALAADMDELAVRWMHELSTIVGPAGKPDERVIEQSGPEVSGDDFHIDDSLRAGRAPATSVGARVDPEPAIEAAETMRFCRPQWTQGADQNLSQAQLRFDPPGVEAGERVLVEGPSGEELTLLVPAGLMHVQRALALVSRGERNKADTSVLQLDILPLSLSALPGSRVDVAGTTILLPPYVVAGTSICVALPVPSQ